MSVVVFDGSVLASDSICIYGDVLYEIPKQGSHGDYVAGFVGDPAIAQYILRAPVKAKVTGFLEALAIMEEVSLKCEEGADLLIISPDSDTMAIIHSKNPVLFLPKQPYYLGASDGMSLYNYCKATEPRGHFAVRCVEQCIKASNISAAPFAMGPVNKIEITTRKVTP